MQKFIKTDIYENVICLYKNEKVTSLVSNLESKPCYNINILLSPYKLRYASYQSRGK